MPLLLQMRKNGRWTTIGEHHVGQAPGSISHNGKHGRQIYMFACHGDHSIIQRSKAGMDGATSSFRVISSNGFEQVARLTDGYPNEEFFLKTDNMPEPVDFRFHHTR